MLKCQSTIIERHLDELIENTRCSTAFISYLQAKSILHQNEAKQLLSNFREDSDRVYEFYDLIRSRRDSYSILKEALHVTKQTGALDILNNHENQPTFKDSNCNSQTNKTLFKECAGVEAWSGDVVLPHGTRNEYLLLIGLKNSGKTSTINSLFGIRQQFDEGCFSFPTQKVLEYNVDRWACNASDPHIITVIDTPGFGGTIFENRNEYNSQVLATLESILDKHRQQGSLFPTAVLLVIDFSDNEIESEDSQFIHLLKAVKLLIKSGRLVDTTPSRCNLIIVLTHVINSPVDIQKNPGSRVKTIQGLIKTVIAITADIPIVLAENKAQEFQLEADKGSFKLPNGDSYPYNLLHAYKQISTKDRNSTVAEALFYEQKISTLLFNLFVTETALVNAEEETVRRFYDKLCNHGKDVHDNQITRLLQTEWNKLLRLKYENNPSILQTAKAAFLAAEINSVSDIPQNAADILQLIQSLVMNTTLEKTLYAFGIVPPSLLDHCNFAGCFYDIRNDVVSSVTPFDINDQAITSSGFRAPKIMKVDMIGNTAAKSCILMTSYESMEQYFVSRFNKLYLKAENPSIGNIDSEPLLGHNIIPNDVLPTKITGIREFRAYWVSLNKDIKFSSQYINTLKKLSSYNIFTMWKWAAYLSQGVHVIKSTYIGGMVSVTATRNSNVENKTSVEDLNKTIMVILENIGEVNMERKFQTIEDWTFELKFHGGDANAGKPRLDNLFCEDGSKLFNEWKKSIQLHPKLLVTEIQLEHISAFLKTEYPLLSERVSYAAYNAIGYNRFVDPDKPRNYLCNMI